MRACTYFSVCSVGRAGTGLCGRERLPANPGAAVHRHTLDRVNAINDSLRKKPLPPKLWHQEKSRRLTRRLPSKRYQGESRSRGGREKRVLDSHGHRQGSPGWRTEDPGSSDPHRPHEL